MSNHSLHQSVFLFLSQRLLLKWKWKCWDEIATLCTKFKYDFLTTTLNDHWRLKLQAVGMNMNELPLEFSDAHFSNPREPALHKISSSDPSVGFLSFSGWIARLKSHRVSQLYSQVYQLSSNMLQLSKSWSVFDFYGFCSQRAFLGALDSMKFGIVWT